MDDFNQVNEVYGKNKKKGRKEGGKKE